MRTTSFHPSLSITTAITKYMTSSFASFVTSFLVVTLPLPNIKIIISSVTDANQEVLQHTPLSCALCITGKKKTSLLLLREWDLSNSATPATRTPNYTHQSAFRLEIATAGQNPTEMSWILSDAKTNQVIHFEQEGDDMTSLIYPTKRLFNLGLGDSVTNFRWLSNKMMLLVVYGMMDFTMYLWWQTCHGVE
jgi:hypothetical protein